MVNLVEFAVVIEIRNRDNYSWKEFLGMLGIFPGCLPDWMDATELQQAGLQPSQCLFIYKCF